MIGRATNGVSSAGWALLSCGLLAICSAPSPLAAAEAWPKVAESLRIEPTSVSAPSSPLSSVRTDVLDGRMIACRAVRNWTPAQALRARGRTVVEAFSQEDECTRRAAQAIATFLDLQACQQEDIAAANGLRAYYTRIAVAEQLRLGDEAHKLVDAEEAKQHAALHSGLAASVDLSSFQRRQLEIEDQQLQLRSQDRQLRSLLAQLADCDYAFDTVWQENLDVQVNALDCDSLTTMALGKRHDLRSWRYLCAQVNETSAPIFARLLSTAVGSFGLPTPMILGLKSLFCPPDHEQFARNLQRELNLTVETHRRWIEQSVAEKCAKLELAYGRMELAQQTVSSWQARRQQLEQLVELGKPDAAQSAAARIGWLESRTAEISRRLEARLAEIELAEASGELARRCCSGEAWLVTGK